MTMKVLLELDAICYFIDKAHLYIHALPNTSLKNLCCIHGLPIHITSSRIYLCNPFVPYGVHSILRFVFLGVAIFNFIA